MFHTFLWNYRVIIVLETPPSLLFSSFKDSEAMFLSRRDCQEMAAAWVYFNASPQLRDPRVKKAKRCLSPFPGRPSRSLSCVRHSWELWVSRALAPAVEKLLLRNENETNSAVKLEHCSGGWPAPCSCRSVCALGTGECSRCLHEQLWSPPRTPG